jgi:guanine deaminase
MEDMQKKDIEYLKKAIEIANRGMLTEHGGPFGALVVKDDRIVGKGFNRVTASNDPTAHAEIMAIRDACTNLETFQLTGCTIYSSCEPCPMCLGAIYWARLDRLVYSADRMQAMEAGFDDEFIYKEIALPPDLRKVVTSRVELDESTALFERWITEVDKTPY